MIRGAHFLAWMLEAEKDTEKRERNEGRDDSDGLGEDINLLWKNNLCWRGTGWFQQSGLLEEAEEDYRMKTRDERRSRKE